MRELRDMLRAKADPIGFDAAVPTALRRRIRRRQLGTVAIAGAVVSLLVVGAVSLPQISGDSQVRTPADSPQPAEPSATDVETFQVLEPGVHHVVNFAAPFTFETHQEGWGISPWYTSAFFAVEHYDGGRLTGDVGFHVIDEVFDPRRIEQTVPAPADFVAWLESHPLLEVTSRRTVEVAGLQGTRLQVLAVRTFAPQRVPACAEPCVPLAYPDGSPTSMQVGESPRPLWVLEVYGRTIAINTDPYDPSFDQRAEALLRTVRFDP